MSRHIEKRKPSGPACMNRSFRSSSCVHHTKCIHFKTLIESIIYETKKISFRNFEIHRDVSFQGILDEDLKLEIKNILPLSPGSI
jgi:hypothetical protein